MLHTTLILGLSLFSNTPLISGLKIASSLSTIEYTPELVADQDYYKGSASITNGGVANIVSDNSIDLASNAETQALRQYATHKNLRIIYTVSEVYYRIVASKKAGITSPKDLKGKKIGTFSGTSAAYFVQLYLDSVGLKETDYTTVSGNICLQAPCGSGTLPYMLAHGSVDAVGLWEPTVELAAQALGSDAVIFENQTVYREIFNLHSTAEKLKDATTRAAIVAYLKALTQAEKVFDSTPDSVYARVAKAVNVNTDILKAIWHVHKWRGGLPIDLLDVLVAEDQWVAKQDRRTAMSRAELTNLIDSRVLAEAMANTSSISL